MVMDAIERDFQERVSRQVRLAAEGVDRYRVLTPFMFENGDHLAIAMKRCEDRWVLSDEGHTFMHLTYDLDEKDLQKGTRARIISDALSAFCVEDREGELILEVKDERYGNALYSFIQAVLKISDVSFLTRERVRSAFLEDFHRLLEERISEDRRAFDWGEPTHDPDAKYLVDCRINGTARPLFVFALNTDDKVRDVTISLLQFEKWGIGFRSMGVFQDQERVNRKVLARFSDVCEKQFSCLASNRDRIGRYLAEALGQA